jgi:hypothetical protein
MSSLIQRGKRSDHHHKKYYLCKQSVPRANDTRFDPSRWEQPTRQMEDALMPFGGGSRTCIGMHLARAELRLSTARFFRKFPKATISTKEGMTVEDMDQIAYFLMSPKGKRCIVQVW